MTPGGSDADLRRLEREAASGDAEAVALFYERLLRTDAGRMYGQRLLAEMKAMRKAKPRPRSLTVTAKLPGSIEVRVTPQRRLGGSGRRMAMILSGEVRVQAVAGHASQDGSGTTFSETEKMLGPGWSEDDFFSAVGSVIGRARRIPGEIAAREALADEFASEWRRVRVPGDAYVRFKAAFREAVVTGEKFPTWHGTTSLQNATVRVAKALPALRALGPMSRLSEIEDALRKAGAVVDGGLLSPMTPRAPAASGRAAPSASED